MLHSLKALPAEQQRRLLSAATAHATHTMTEIESRAIRRPFCEIPKLTG